jgi:hypothetical protein
MILVIKGFFLNEVFKMSITKIMPLNGYSSMEKNIKIQIIFDIENGLKVGIGTFSMAEFRRLIY